MTQTIRYRVVDGIALIALMSGVDNPLTPQVRRELDATLSELEEARDIRGAILFSMGEIFSGGADVRELGRKDSNAPTLADLCNRIEMSEFPICASLHNAIMGGAVELAMACHYRVGRSDVAFSLPFLSLGVLPAAGGTQRLPRLIGVKHSLSLLVGGKTMEAKGALKRGLLDHVVDDRHVEHAYNFLRTKIENTAPIPRTCARDERLTDGRSYLMHIANARHEAKGTPIFAQNLTIDALEAALVLSFEAGLVFEADAVERCDSHPQSKGLIHMFMAERVISSDLMEKNGDRFVLSSAESRAVASSLRSAIRIATKVSVPDTEDARGTADAAIVKFGLPNGPFGGTESGHEDPDLIRRIHGALLSRGGLALEEGLVSHPSDLDAIAVHGFGYPRHYGGPMRMAQSSGLRSLVADMEKWAEGHPIWKVPAVIRTAAISGGFDQMNAFSSTQQNTHHHAGQSKSGEHERPEVEWQNTANAIT